MRTHLLSSDTAHADANDLRFAVALGLRAAGAQQEALALYRAMLRADPDNAGALRQRVPCAIAANRLDLAPGYLEAGLAKLPDDPVLLQARAALRGRTAAAAGTPAPSGSTAPDKPLSRAERLADARRLLEEGALDQAAAELDALLGEAPDFLPALITRSRVAQIAKRPGQVLETCLRGLVLQPLNPSLLTRRAAARRQLGQGDLAIAELQAVLRDAPGIALSVRFALADTLMAVGRTGEAGDVLTAILEAEPDNPKAHLGRIGIALAHGDVDEALERCDAALAIHPGDVQVLLRKAQAYLQAARPVEALSLLEGLGDREHETEAGVQLRQKTAAALIAAGRPGEAERIYRDMLADAPLDPDALAGLATIAEQRGDLEGALAGMEAALWPRQ